jgi:hypothetical protein
VPAAEKEVKMTLQVDSIPIPSEQMPVAGVKERLAQALDAAHELQCKVEWIAIEAADLFGDLTGIGKELVMRDNAAVAKAIDAAAWVDSAAINAADELSVLIANVDYVINPE